MMLIPVIMTCNGKDDGSMSMKRERRQGREKTVSETRTEDAM